MCFDMSFFPFSFRHLFSLPFLSLLFKLCHTVCVSTPLRFLEEYSPGLHCIMSMRSILVSSYAIMPVINVLDRERRHFIITCFALLSYAVLFCAVRWIKRNNLTKPCRHPRQKFLIRENNRIEKRKKE